MASAGHNRPIIKRKKVINEAGHHGGAWKVAYADFVTAMMAFFMLMWLLNATTEDQRKGIADYFNPTIPIFRVSGGGDGATRGESIIAQEDKAESGQRGEPDPERDPEAALRQAGSGASPFWQQASGADALEEVETLLKATGGESAAADRLLRHIRTRVTDEGLIVEIFDLPDSALFAPGSATPEPILEDLAAMLSDVFAIVSNNLAIAGHTAARPIVVADNPVWQLSAERADAMRLLMKGAGFAPARLSRIAGHADRAPADPDPMAPRNNRLELTLLRNGR
ncbi:MAG TPA: chemotaxis protein MotB [Rhodobacteraceae bacterium]|jgi:chemotaxis protein MotB|nr:chemotaxis protein MotB [Paracoccaceae bacterium]HBG98067.1 chemotaxis protein MotB [Paracoccaceae bacterium]